MENKSKLDNIYALDEAGFKGNERRHAANLEEANWTVEAASRGCSGILISPSHMLLNAHCEPSVGDTYRSGRAVIAQAAKDIRVVKVLESVLQTNLDYALLEISWLRPMDNAQTFPPYIAQSAGDIMISSKAGEGDSLFTVGFPIDKTSWAGTYSEGQAKAITDGSILRYNIGVINGNSGGGLIKKDSGMLVGIVKGGQFKKDEEGWNKNDIDAPESWNTGVPIWEINRASKVLKTIYPSGKHYLYKNQFMPRTRIFAAIESGAQSNTVWMSAGYGTEKIILCAASVSVCEAGAKNASTLAFVKTLGDRRLFKSMPTKVQLDGTSFQVLALDAQGQIMAKRRLKVNKIISSSKEGTP